MSRHPDRTPADQSRLIPVDYGHPAATAETHISTLWFVGDRAYKLKKPVRFGFLDFSTRDARETACHREVELNRRLSPDVYLGVMDLVGPDGDPVDHMVVMRRMPPSQRLETLVKDGDPAVSDHLRHLARLLADFHSRAERSTTINLAAGVSALQANWADNDREMSTHEQALDRPGARDRIRVLVDRYLTGRAEMFEQRIADGRVCDGHGDLQAADIYCLDDGPRVLDCIEFSDHLRHGDVINDMAFLAMDLDRLGAPDAGRALMDWYREFSGDNAPVSLVEHYIANRAFIRSKVACLRAAQETGDEREAALAEGRRLLAMAERYLRRGQVRLVLIGGSPGTGKSTVAGHVGETMGWTVLRSDEIRREIVGPGGPPGDTDMSTGKWQQGRYSPAMTDRVYRTMLDRARTALRWGETVVLDASWSDPRHREWAENVAADDTADLEALRCDAPVEVATARVTRRSEAGLDPSDATEDVARRMARTFQPWPGSAVIDTDRPVGEVRDLALELLGVGGYKPPDVIS